jgi:hypothetical protein
MKALAKRDYIYETKCSDGQFDYHWTKDKIYNAYIDKKFYKTIVIDDDNQEVHFCGEPKHLEELFDFVEED